MGKLLVYLHVAVKQRAFQSLLGAGLSGVAITAVGRVADFERALHTGLFNLDPTKQDTDFDGLPDGREIVIGTNPNTRDSGSVTDSDAAPAASVIATALPSAPNSKFPLVNSLYARSS